MDEQDKKQLMQHGEILTDLMLRMSALETILISKNIITEEELTNETLAQKEKLMEMVKNALSGGFDGGGGI